MLNFNDDLMMIAFWFGEDVVEEKSCEKMGIEFYPGKSRHSLTNTTVN